MSLVETVIAEIIKHAHLVPYTNATSGFKRIKKNDDANCTHKIDNTNVTSRFKSEFVSNAQNNNESGILRDLGKKALSSVNIRCALRT